MCTFDWGMQGGMPLVSVGLGVDTVSRVRLILFFRVSSLTVSAL
jgi:hypothetical protein